LLEPKKSAPPTYDGAVVGVAACFSHSSEQGSQILASGGQAGSHLSVRDIHDSVRVNDVGLPPRTRVVDSELKTFKAVHLQIREK
jgi:hypothetical protein